MINTIELYLVTNLLCRGKYLWDVCEQGIHLLRRLHPLLLAIAHALGVVEILPRTQTNQAIVRLCILFIQEVNIICCNHLHTVLLPQLQQDSIHLLLLLVGLLVPEGIIRLVSL